MKKSVFIIAALLLAACSSDKEEIVNESDLVTIDWRFCFDQEPLTKAEVVDYCTHLDIWIVDDENVTAYNQAQGDEGFGSLSVTLNRTKTYTMYAVAHKAAGAATLSNGVISWPDDKVTHTFFYSQTFTPTAGSVEIDMQRIVAQFRLEITDEIPAAVKKLRFTINNVFDRWNVSTGGTHQLDRVSTVNYGGSSAIFSVYAIVTGENTNHNITMEALDANDAVITSHTLSNVPLCNGYRTIARGAFFNSSSTFSFAVPEIEELTTITF